MYSPGNRSPNQLWTKPKSKQLPTALPNLEDANKHLYYPENQADLDGSRDINTLDGGRPQLPLGPGFVDPQTDVLKLGPNNGDKLVSEMGPDAEDSADDSETDEKIMRASLAAQRKALRKGQLRGRLSTIMHSSFQKSNKLG